MQRNISFAVVPHKFTFDDIFILVRHVPLQGWDR